jgi:hypothetical protein
MKRIIRGVAFLGLLSGGAFLAEDKAHACASYTVTETSCTCRYFISTGYNTCTQVGAACVLTGSGCGGGPGTVPV